MNRTTGIITESSDRNPEIDLCRLCREKHDCYYSIFTSNVACKITVKDALHDLVGLQVAVGDGLPTTMCPQCLKKLTEFSVFKKICLESNAILRKSFPSSCFRSFGVRGADDEESEPCVESKDCIQDAIENTSEFTCSAQMTEVYIPVPDCLLPRDDKLDADCDHMQAQASTSSQGEEVDAEGTGAIVIDLDSIPVLAEKESAKETDATEPTSMENGELIQKQTMAMESMTEAVGDGQFHSKSRRVSEIRGDSATTTVVGEISGCDNPESTKVSRVTDSGKSGPKAVVRENKEISTSMIKNPGKRAKSKDNSYHCFNCGDAFNSKYDLGEHFKIHFGSGSLDIDANLSIGKQLALKPLVSRGETDSFYQPTSSKSLNKPLFKRQGVIQKGKGVIKEKFGGTMEKRNVREVRRSSISDESSYTESPRSTKKPYSCGECEKSFSQKSHLVRHIRTHTNEKPYSCSECEKSFSQNSSLVRHIRTHTKEKPYSCSECEKSFSDRSNLVCHMRIHTKEKPYSCGECEKSFSVKCNLVNHIRTHTKEKPYFCGECENSSSRKDLPVKHIRTHTKEKPFSCNECEKSFSVKSHLNYHIWTHTMKKSYSCCECEKSYTTKRNLVLHMCVHRKEALFLH